MVNFRENTRERNAGKLCFLVKLEPLLQRECEYLLGEGMNAHRTDGLKRQRHRKRWISTVENVEPH